MMKALAVGLLLVGVALAMGLVGDPVTMPQEPAVALVATRTLSKPAPSVLAPPAKEGVRKNGTISGRITRAGSEVLALTRVEAVTFADGQPTPVAVSSLADGRYTLTLPAGAYGVRAVRLEYATGIVDDCWYGQDDQPMATVLEVRPGAQVGDVDIVMDRIPFATVEGRVFDTQGRPRRGVEVALLDLSQSMQQLAVTDGDGRFRLEAIPPRGYKLHFKATGEETGAAAFYRHRPFDQSPTLDLRDGEHKAIVFSL
ncbi:MAG: carboxypeptidase-like regulatory domain-containing protein [Pseudomonadota bacterium]